MSMANISPVQPLPIKAKWVSSNWKYGQLFFPSLTLTKQAERWAE